MMNTTGTSCADKGCRPLNSNKLNNMVEIELHSIIPTIYIIIFFYSFKKPFTVVLIAEITVVNIFVALAVLPITVVVPVIFDTPKDSKSTIAISLSVYAEYFTNNFLILHELV